MNNLESLNYKNNMQILAAERGLKLIDTLDSNGDHIFQVTKNSKVLGAFKGAYGWSEAEQMYSDELIAIVYKIKKQ